MSKRGMDDEALVIQRSAREIETLDDPTAQARVALFLYLRYTAAGDRIAPGGVAPSPVPSLPAASPQTAPSNPPAAEPDRTPPPVKPFNLGPAPGEPSGWNLAGDPEGDDEGSPDDEVEVEI